MRNSPLTPGYWGIAGIVLGILALLGVSPYAGGSAGIQFLTGLAAVVLGIIAVAVTREVRSEALTLVALLVVGLTNIISGSALSGLVLSFMRSESQTGGTISR